MIELIIMAGVVYWYFQAARRNGRNGWLWGFVGALSYYMPMLLVAIVIAPAIIFSLAPMGPGDEGFYSFLSVAIGVVTGVTCCVLLKRAMERQWGKG
jgi:hypothetical protein